MHHINRRTALRGIAAISAAGGATAAAALPAEETPQERALRHWQAFSEAMSEITAGTDGWIIYGAGERRHERRTERWLHLRSIKLEQREDARQAGMLVEIHRVITLGGRS